MKALKLDVLRAGFVRFRALSMRQPLLFVAVPAVVLVAGAGVTYAHFQTSQPHAAVVVKDSAKKKTEQPQQGSQQSGASAATPSQSQTTTLAGNTPAATKPAAAAPNYNLTLNTSSITVTTGSTVKKGQVIVSSSAGVDFSYFSVNSSGGSNLFSATITKGGPGLWYLDIGPAFVQGVAPGTYAVTISAAGPNKTTYSAPLTITVVSSDTASLTASANFPASGDVKRIDITIKRFNGDTSPTQGIIVSASPLMSCSQSSVDNLNSSYESYVYFCTRTSSSDTAFTVYVQATVGGKTLTTSVPVNF